MRTRSKARFNMKRHVLKTTNSHKKAEQYVFVLRPAVRCCLQSMPQKKIATRCPEISGLSRKKISLTRKPAIIFQSPYVKNNRTILLFHGHFHEFRQKYASKECVSLEIWFNDAKCQNLRPECSVNASSTWYNNNNDKISLFQEDNIFGTNASLTYGHRLQR